MNILKTVVALNEDAPPSGPKEVIDRLSKALVGKKITAFGPNGRGLWGDHHEVQSYRIKRVVGHLGPMDDGEPEWGNIDIHLDGYHAGGVKGKDEKGNPTILGGMIYTDRTFEKHLKALLHSVPAMKYVKSIGYSEQGMQGKNFVNLDIVFNKKELNNAMADSLIRKGGKLKEDAAEQMPAAPKKHEPLPKIGQNIVEHLQALQATLDMLCIKTRGFSFNVVEESFYEFHSFLNLTIDYLHKESYEVAERVRSIDAMANYALADVSSKSRIKDAEKLVTSFPEMVKELLADYEIVSDLARRIFHMATEVVDAGTIALATSLALKIEHFMWEIRVMVGKDPADKVKESVSEAKKNDGDYDIHVKKVPSGTYYGKNLTHTIIDTKHPVLKKRYGETGDGLSAAALATIKKAYKVKEAEESLCCEFNLVEAKKAEKKDPSSVILDIAVQGGGHKMGTDEDTIKWAKKFNCTAKKLNTGGRGGWPEWKFTGDPKDIRRLVTNYTGKGNDVEYLLGHED